jgi:hypothetical protein
MPKSSLPFNPNEYALVVDRITLFYERHPTGRIVTELISRDRDVLFKASVYRSATDPKPSATGWASEREGDGEINMVACVENTETSAIGRALANLGFTASTRRPSREEMDKAERGGSRLYKAPEKTQALGRVAETPNVATRDRAADVIKLVLEAGSHGMPAAFLQELKQRVGDRSVTADELLEIERRVRYWLLHRAGPVAPNEQDAAPSNPLVNSPHQ